ncbi:MULTISPECIES: energy transducer TonB [Shewanella]|uniref:energy transducer TonB n=1 Tax=Shewanella TaxID=22 RepID=UPI0015671F4E|nr:MULTISPECIES: energy transducer TonB [Shewanella]MBW3516532.1 TonB family protein [Shewanella sp. NKUCC01_JLK]MCU8020640.1 TonB family protein [Shewanella sp. SM78]MCU8043069.1 TonB family protein [Shewanella sp. SM68]MCU8047443.1 TonB family protein [Shewanella sp. SM65]MCU8077949.1 TonB family protein [Shewanella sp. SM103]
MTPKRYLAFGALTVAIQTGVIASQPAMTMQPSAQSSSVNQASLTPSANTVTLNFSTATSAASNTSAEPIKQTDAKVATVNSTVQKNSTAQKVSTAESVNKAVIPKTKADQRIDSQLAKKSSATKPTANNHPNTDPLATNALEPSALNPSVLAHKRLEQIEHQTEPKTAQMDLITNAAEVDAKATPNVASETADSAQTNIVELAKPLFAAAPPQPTYPKIARKKGLEGTATIEVMFNELGEQLALTLVKSSGFSLLDQAALDAVENWQFAAPAQRLASHYKVRVPIRFALN